MSENLEFDLQDISLEGNLDDAKVKICQYWPQARTTLELLAEVIKNPVAKTVIRVVIGIGNAICKDN